MSTTDRTHAMDDTTLSRRAFLGAGAGAALAATALLTNLDAASALTPPVGDANWPLPAHDLRATRDGTGINGSDVRWRQTLTGGIASAPAIVAGDVYAASVGGVVASFALRSGALRWTRDLGTAAYGSGDNARDLGFFGGAAAAQGRVIAASDRVFCLDAATGRVRWRTAPLRTTTSDDYFWGAPVVAGDLVVLGSGSGAELPTARGRVTAYSLHDGTPVWSTPTVPTGANGGGIIGPASVDIRRGVAYVTTGAPYEAVAGSNPGTCSLIALSLRDGRVLWSDQVFAGNTTGFDFNSAPVIIGRLLVATNKNGFYAWDRFTHERVWSRQITPSISDGTSATPVDGPEGGPIATDGERIYGLSNDGANGACVAVALAPRTGAIVWTRTLPSFSFAAPAVAGDQLAVPGADGTLRLLDCNTGTPKTEVGLGEPSACPPVSAGGRVVIGTGAEPFLPGSSLLAIG